MLQVSIFVEGLRSHPRAMFWLATLVQAAIWFLVPALFYSAPPGALAETLVVGHQFQLGTGLGPPLAFWLGELAYVLAGIGGVYLLSQICVVVTYWAVFSLGCAIVGTQHAAIAVLLMLGISAMTVPSPDFGPPMLAMALWALIVLHFWRAIGEDKRRYWFVLAIEIGLLLLTTYAGLIMLASLMLFTGMTPRGRAALRTIEPWFAAIVVAVMLFPHLIWLDVAGAAAFEPTWARLRSAQAAGTNLVSWGRLLAGVVIAHAGLLTLVGLASGWRFKPREALPVFTRRAVDPFARQFVFFLAFVPVLIATLIAAIIDDRAPVGGTAPYVTLSGLAAVLAAGDAIAIYRQRVVALAWMLILLLPPMIAVVAIVVLPWTAAIELRIAQPANAMGRFFSENFERRTGKPLEIVTGDPRLAALVALSAPSRPSFYDYANPAHTPWVGADDIRRKGVIVVWPASDTAGLPPADIKAHFPDLVPEVPRAFDHVIQGRLPLARVGWGMIRPRAQ
jgi:4-amino-4-deoxy-L-arabinose transferase-like glycosyltransferase